MVCAETGMLATDKCPNVTTEMFTEGSEPSEYCSTHPGHPLQPAVPGMPPLDERQDLRQFDRTTRDGEPEKIHTGN